MTMELLIASAIAVLTAAGVYLVLRGRTFPVVLGLAFLSYAINLFLFAMGRLVIDRPPIYDKAAEQRAKEKPVEGAWMRWEMEWKRERAQAADAGMGHGVERDLRQRRTGPDALEADRPGEPDGAFAAREQVHLDAVRRHRHPGVALRPAGDLRRQARSAGRDRQVVVENAPQDLVHGVDRQAFLEDRLEDRRYKLHKAFRAGALQQLRVDIPHEFGECFGHDPTPDCGLSGQKARRGPIFTAKRRRRLRSPR